MMKIKFDGFGSQFNDNYRVVFTITIAAIIIGIGLYVGANGGRGIIIGGLVGLSVAVFQNLTYRLELPNTISFDYDGCLSSIGYCSVKRGVYDAYTIFPQFENHKIFVEIGAEHIILRSARCNLKRVVRCIEKFTAPSPK